MQKSPLGGQLPFRPPPPPPKKWPEVLTAVATAAAATVSVIAILKDASPQLTRLVFCIVVVAAFFPVAHIFQKVRERHRARAAAKASALAEEEELSRLTRIVNAVLKNTAEHLAPGRSTANTVAYAVENLTSHIDGATQLGMEANNRRKTVVAGSRIFGYLPSAVEPSQGIIVGELADRAIHDFVKDLPEYIEACEKASAQGEKWKHEGMMKEADLLRARINEFLEEYNRLAKEAASGSSGRRILTPFDRARFLLAPRASTLT